MPPAEPTTHAPATPTATHVVPSPHAELVLEEVPEAPHPDRAAGFVVRLAGPDDRPHVEALLAEMIPGVDVAARWRWLYEGSPGGPALTWLVIAPSGEIAGCTSFVPFRLWHAGRELRAALGADGYVRPAFRRRGLGGLLHDASRRDMPAHGIACMYGAPGAMNVTPLEKGGSRRVGEVARYVRPLRLGPAPVQRVIARLQAGAAGRGPELTPMAERDRRVDAVWADARADLATAAVRDAAFYTWRWRHAPAQRQPAFVIVDDDEPIAACALELLHDGQELHILDLVARPGRWHVALRAITRHAARATAARTVSVKLFAPDARRRQVWRNGFVEREAKPFLCMIPPGGDATLLDPRRWFYSGADSDLDSLA